MRSVASRLQAMFTSAPILDWCRGTVCACNWPTFNARRSPASARRASPRSIPVSSLSKARARLDVAAASRCMARAGAWVTMIGPWPTAAPAIAAGAKVPAGTRSTLNIQGPTQVAGAWWHWSEAGALNGPLAGAPRRNFTGYSNANPRQSSPIQRPIAGSYLPIK